ncbi:MAG: hypothetical protein M3Z04_14725 [Chloroflexota bacterium]|nr:hypothetical protein [Chloroflexota bacterium]
MENVRNLKTHHLYYSVFCWLLLLIILVACNNPSPQSYMGSRNPTELPITNLTPAPGLPDDLYPTLPNSALLMAYPGAQYLQKMTTNSKQPVQFAFETNDSAATIRTFYQALLTQQGWQDVGPPDGSGVQRYYWGDHGQRYIYGFYLNFYAINPGDHLKTYVRMLVNPTLPVYLGAKDVVQNDHYGVDSSVSDLSFTTTDNPEIVTRFYESLLTQDGWLFTSGAATPTWTKQGGNQCDYLNLSTQRSSTGRTQIRLEHTSGDCR